MTEENKGPNILKVAAIGILVALALITAITWNFQGILIYGKPSPYQPSSKSWTEIKIDHPDGKMISYYSKASEGNPTIIFFHGRGYGYEGSVKALEKFTEAGVGSLIVEYPGYGGNPGKYNEESGRELANAAYKWLIKNKVASEDVVIYGEGVGAGPAVIAAQNPVRRLLIVSGFSSMTEMVQDKYPYVPGFMIQDKWDLTEEIKKAKGRVTIVHGTENEAIRFSQGEKLANASKTKIIEIPGNHNIAFDTGLQFSLAVSVKKK